MLLFHVSDLQASLAFYVRKLNFEVVATSETTPPEEESHSWAMLRTSDLTLMLRSVAKADKPALPDPVRVSYHADTVLYLVCADLEALCSHLRQKGITPLRGADPLAHMDQVFVSDPDGYMLCFQRLSKNRLQP